MAPRVASTSSTGVIVDHGSDRLQVHPTAEGLRFVRNWRPCEPTETDLLALVEAMALLLMQGPERFLDTPAEETTL